PMQLWDEEGRYVLHPGLANSALLAAAVLSGIQDGQRRMRGPFNLEALWIYAKIPRSAYGHARGSAGQSQEKVKKYDIDVLDEQGRCVMAFRGLTLMPAKSAPAMVYATPRWRREALKPGSLESASGAAPIFVLSSEDAVLRRGIAERWEEARIEVL